MSRRRVNRMAPARFVASPDAASRAHRGFWRGLKMAFVPTPGSTTGAGIRELLHGFRPNNNTLAVRGEAHGLAASAVGNGVNFADAIRIMPTAVPFSVFAFVVRRDSTAALQSLFGNGFTGNGGWTFQLNYGAGQIGLTRWGIADNPSTTLGAVPNTGGQASGVGVTLDGTTARFFLNGRFQSIASGTVNAPSTANVSVGRNGAVLAPLVNTSIHVLYVWNRVVSDQEMLALWMDPWAPIRPSPMSVMELTASTIARTTQVSVEGLIAPAAPVVRKSQLALEALVKLPVQTRATQIIAEALITAPTAASTARLSTLVLEALGQPDPMVRLGQLALEVLHRATPGVRFTQVDLEALLQGGDPTVRSTQLSLEALVQVAALTPTYTGQLFPRGSPPPF